MKSAFVPSHVHRYGHQPAWISSFSSSGGGISKGDSDSSLPLPTHGSRSDMTFQQKQRKAVNARPRSASSSAKLSSSSSSLRAVNLSGVAKAKKSDIRALFHRWNDALQTLDPAQECRLAAMFLLLLLLIKAAAFLVIIKIVS